MTRNRGTLVAILIVASVMLWCVAGEAAPTGIATDSVSQPPPYQGQPLDIAVGLHIVNIASIDEVTEQFEMDAYVFARWLDPRLAFTPGGPDDMAFSAGGTELWATGRWRSQVDVIDLASGALKGTSLDLAQQQITLGRANDATLVLNDDYASSRHARIFPQDGQWIVEDLGSTNGTYLDRQKVTRPMPVPVGVPIRIGKTVLELRR